MSTTPTAVSNNLQSGESLQLGEALHSPNGRYRLELQASDGNLVLYHQYPGGGQHPIWATMTQKDAGHADFAGELVMQTDGNLVLYRAGHRHGAAHARWSSGTNKTENEGAALRLQNDGNLVLYVGDKALWSSGTWSYAHWMEDLPDHLTLKTMCIPGSHDAGMYDTKNWARGTALAQAKDLYGQLRAGSRYFDLRPRHIEGKGYYVYHGPADGPKLEEVLKGVKQFFDEGTDETVILCFSAWKDFEQSETQQRAGLQFILDHLPQQHLLRVPRSTSTAPDPVTKAVITDPLRLNDLPLAELRGKLIVLVQDNNYHEEGTGNRIYQDIVLPDVAKDADKWPGVYSINHEAKVFDHYSDKRDYQEMVDHQAGEFTKFDNADELFLLNWTLTPHSTTFLVRSSVEGYASEINPRLATDARDNKQGLFGINNQGEMVNIINLDYMETADVVNVCRLLIARNSPPAPQP